MQATWRGRWIVVPALATGVALVLAGCAKTREDIKTATNFIKEANALSSRPDTTGPYPSPFAADALTPSETVLSPEARRQAYVELQQTGAAAKAETLAREAKLREISPY